MFGSISEALREIEGRDRILVRCPFRAVLGIRCPGCGMTHALVALAQGQVRRALGYNPYVLLLLPLLIWGVFDFTKQAASTVKRVRAARS